MSNFIFKKFIGDTWIILPIELMGGNASTTTPALMKRFSGMVFDTLRAGSHNLPQSEFSLPNGDVASLSIALGSTLPIQAPIRLCVGFFMLDDNAAFNDGEFEIDTTISNKEQIYGAFNFKITIKNGSVINYAWQNTGADSVPFIIRSLNFVTNSNCFPVIFAVEDSEEFNSSYIIDERNNETLFNYGITAKWANPIESEGTHKRVNFSVSGIGANDFNMPQGYWAVIGSTITLPTYESVFINSYIPYGWLIDDVEYALGSSFTMPGHNVTANLIYNDKRYSGYVF